MANGALGGLPAPVRELQPNDTLHRALTKKLWLENGNFPEAFILRADEDGLSVCFDCAPEECGRILNLKVVHGVASLVVNGVTALGLTVTPDEPHHAEIEGIPHREANPLQAEWLASRLADIATIVDRTRRVREQAP